MTLTSVESATAMLMAVLVASAVRTVILAAIVGAALAICRVRRTMWRLSAWTFVLGAALAMPALSRVLPDLRVPVAARALAWLPSAAPQVQSGASEPGVQVRTAASTDSRLPAGNPDAALIATDASAPIRQRTAGSAVPVFSLSRVLIGIYLAGVMALALRAITGWVATRRLERASRVIEDATAAARFARISSTSGLRRTPRMAESDQLFVPVTMSATRPIVMLPASWRTWDVETLEAVLVHEVSHVARRDAVTQHASLLYRAIFWFNPLAWWLRHELVELAERASDEAVLSAGTSQTHYARMLVEFFRAVPQTGHRADWHVAMARGTATSAEARIDRILTWKGGQVMRLRKSAVLSAVLVMTAVVAVTASVRPAASAAERTTTDATQPASTPVLVPVEVPQTAVETVIAKAPHPPRARTQPVRTETTVAPTPSPDTAAPLQTPAPATAPAPIQTGFGAGAYRPSAMVTWPKDIQQSKPQYTDDALDRKIQGIVELEAVVLPDGTVGPVRITKSLDTQYGLDNEAVRATRQWVFEPGHLHGAPVAVVITMQLEFRSNTPAAMKPSGASRLRPLADEFASGAYFASSVGIAAPRATHEVTPTYTPDGLRAKVQGQVDIEIIVMPDGTVGKARVVRSLDTIYGLDEQALAAAGQWKFLPGTLDGKPVPVLVTMTLEFKVRP